MSFWSPLFQVLKKSAQGFSRWRKEGAPAGEALEEVLLTADVDPLLAEAFSKKIASKGLSGPSAAEELRRMLQEKLEKLAPPPETFPMVLLLLGVNGSGKTTTAAKLAARWRGESKTVLFAAADTFRAAAANQLARWAERAKVEGVYGDVGDSPTKVFASALERARKERVDALVVDTAGRLQNRKNLMEELARLHRTAERAAGDWKQERWLVLDGTTGQNAVRQVEEFHREVPLTGMIWTKLEGSAKGGALLALAERLPIPVRYIGTGETLEDLCPFDATAYAEGLIGMAGKEGA